MNKIIRKIVTFAMAAVMIMVFSACGSEKTEIADPVHETDAAGLTEAAGITLDAPEGAEDVTYAYIEAAAPEENVIAQVQFTLDGKAYTYRAAATDETELIGNDEDTSAADMAVALDEGVQKGARLAGLNYDSWKGAASVDISYCAGVYAHTPEKASFAAWIDVVPGVIYCMIADDETDQEVLMKTAESAFVPMQGEEDK